MCSISLGLMGLSAFMQDRAISQQSKAQAAMYNAQAEAADLNAKIADRKRAQIAEKYAQEQMKIDARRKLIRGQQVASAGASGLSNAGSVLDAGTSVIEAYRNDSLNLLGNQRKDTLDAYIHQVNYENQANSSRVAAYNTRQQAKGARLANVISTAASMYGAWSKARTPGFKGAVEEPMGFGTGFTGNLMDNSLSYVAPSSLYASRAGGAGVLGNPFSKTWAGYNAYKKYWR